MKDMLSNQDEIWKPINGYEKIYEISNFGNVRSVNRYYEQKMQNFITCTEK